MTKTVSRRLRTKRMTGTMTNMNTVRKTRTRAKRMACLKTMTDTMTRAGTISMIEAGIKDNGEQCTRTMTREKPIKDMCKDEDNVKNKNMERIRSKTRA